LERVEGLEQLRLMENGCRINLIPIDYHPLSVDTPGDLREVREKLARERIFLDVPEVFWYIIK